MLEDRDTKGLSKHDLTGAVLQASAASYFAQTWARFQNAARTKGVVTDRMPSFGSVSTDSPVTLFFGVPTKISPSGALVDMDRVASISANSSNDKHAWIAFNQADGSTDSRTESGVLEQQYSTADQPIVGVSAVQALAIAGQQGQRIYTITSANAAAAMAQLQASASVMQDVANSVNAGLTVTISQSVLEFAGQSTMGYIIFDPATGAAAYKIANGANGGWILLVAALILLAAAFLSPYLLAGLALEEMTVFVLGAAGAGIGALLAALAMISSDAKFSQIACQISVGVLLAALGVLTNPVLGFLLFGIFLSYIQVIYSDSITCGAS
jgi:hypothetical protein